MMMRFVGIIPKRTVEISFVRSLMNPSKMLLARSYSGSSLVGAPDMDTKTHVHFRASPRPHPLHAKPADAEKYYEENLGDHIGRQQNHIWTLEELDEKMNTLYRHKPQSFSDQIMNKLMYGLYYTFNFFTGYDATNPSVKSIQWRLILLESIAGVPGFVAAGFRHFRSLRKLQSDHGWIATLLEEAENERMHLLICLNMFNANRLTRSLVIAGQYVMTPFLMAIYTIHPKSMHRFVGYLEETACTTYVNTINKIQTPGTHLHQEWAMTPAPKMAIGYYHLPKDALWVDTLKCMMADEANHRDVNHTFASMSTDDPNPFLVMHKENAAFAWRLTESGKPAWERIRDVENIRK
jgi:hypothetical protein